MKNFLTKIKETDLVQNIIRDIKSLRVIWTYLTGLTYLFVVIYATVKYPEAIDTVVTVTGGVLSVIFTNYVFSKNSEKKLRNNLK